MHPDCLVTSDGEDPRPGAARGLVGWRVALYCVLTLASMLVVSQLANLVFPPAERPPLGQKLSLVQSDRETDTLFLGASRVIRHVSPEVFDAGMAERGLATRSFNTALPAMFTFEQQHYLDELLELKLPKLRFVFIAPESVHLSGSDREVKTPRAVQWHTFEATIATSRGILEMDDTLADKALTISRHWMAFLHHTFNLGTARSQLLGTAVGEDIQLASHELASGTRGYRSLDDAMTTDAEFRGRLEGRRSDYLSSLPAFFEAVENLRKAIRDGVGSSELGVEIVTRMQARVEAAGVVPVFLIMPGSSHGSRNYVREAKRRGAIRHLIDLGHPDRHPEFYAPELQFDLGHLNELGARAVTATLAQKFADLIDRGDISVEGN